MLVAIVIICSRNSFCMKAGSAISRPTTSRDTCGAEQQPGHISKQASLVEGRVDQERGASTASAEAHMLPHMLNPRALRPAGRRQAPAPPSPRPAPPRPAAPPSRATPLTEGGSVRVTKRVMLGRTSMDRKRTSAAELNSPICAACRRMSGRSAIVLYHSCSTAAMASAVYSSAKTLRNQPSPSPSPSSPARAGGGGGEREGQETARGSGGPRVGLSPRKLRRAAGRAAGYQEWTQHASAHRFKPAPPPAFGPPRAACTPPPRPARRTQPPTRTHTAHTRPGAKTHQNRQSSRRRRRRRRRRPRH